MFIRLFGITSRRFVLSTSAGRPIPVYRTELPFQLWDGEQFGSNITALWDSGADFFTISEEFADRQRIDWQSAAEQLGSSGITGSAGGVFVPITIRLLPIRDLVFRVDCQVLLGTDFPLPLLGNRFVRRNFDVQTIGERRTYFKLRSNHDGVPVTQLAGN